MPSNVYSSGSSPLPLHSAPDVDEGQPAAFGHRTQQCVELGETGILALHEGFVMHSVELARAGMLSIDLVRGCLPGNDVQQAFVLLQEFLVRIFEKSRSLAPPMMKIASVVRRRSAARG